MPNENKTVIQTTDGKKKIEFVDEDFNNGKPLVVLKYEKGKLKDSRVIRVTPNRRLVMLELKN
jgi:hypothetical protein